MKEVPLPKGNSIDSNYIKLAELSHNAFVERRHYEWKLNFAFWGAIALLVYACTKERIQIFSGSKEAFFIAALLLLLYFFQQLEISRAHDIDKQWKHYYLSRAEGLEDVKRPTPYGKTPKIHRFFWVIAQFVFTAILLYLGFRVLAELIYNSACS